jgi:hypothetical protein
MNGMPLIQNHFEEWEVIDQQNSFLGIEDSLLKELEGKNYYNKVKLKIKGTHQEQQAKYE